LPQISKFSLFLGGLLLVIAGTPFLVSKNAGKDQSSISSFVDTRFLKEGDIVFSHGRDLVSSIIIGHEKQARFSHVGMLVQENGRWKVIHSTPGELNEKGGVRAEPLENFSSSKNISDIAFFRVIGVGAVQRREVKQYLFSQIGRPFDFKFEYSDDASIYCTELVLKALRHAGIDLEPKLKRVDAFLIPEAAIPPESLFKSDQLKELISVRKLQNAIFEE